MYTGLFAVCRTAWGRPLCGRVTETSGDRVHVHGWCWVPVPSLHVTTAFFDEAMLHIRVLEKWKDPRGIEEQDHDLLYIGRRVTVDTCAARGIFYVHVTRPPELHLRTCACGCGTRFVPSRHNKLYARLRCARRARRRRQKRKERS